MCTCVLHAYRNIFICCLLKKLCFVAGMCLIAVTLADVHKSSRWTKWQYFLVSFSCCFMTVGAFIFGLTLTQSVMTIVSGNIQKDKSRYTCWLVLLLLFIVEIVSLWQLSIHVILFEDQVTQTSHACLFVFSLQGALMCSSVVVTNFVFYIFLNGKENM